MTEIDLQRDYPAADAYGSGQPDGAVAAEGTYFEDGARTAEPDQQSKKLALVGCHADGRKARSGAVGQRQVQRRV